MGMHHWRQSEFSETFGHCQSIKEVIAQAEKILWSQGHVVCEIFVNGLTHDEKNEVLLPDITEFSVNSEHPHVLMRNTLQDVLHLIPMISEKCVEAAEDFRLKEMEQTHQAFSELLEMCRYLTDVAHVLKVQYPDAITTEVETQYRDAIKSILTGYEKKDRALLADLLEYELTNVLELVFQQISNFKGRASIS